MVDAGRTMSWGTWLEERDAAPFEVFSQWLREQVPRTTSTEQRSPALNTRPDRLQELSRELFNVQRRSANAVTVEQADLLESVERMAVMKNSDSNAAKLKCQQKLRNEFGPPELLLPFDLFRSYLARFIYEFAQDEQGQEVILQFLIVQAHLNQETKQAQWAQEEAQALALKNAQAKEIAMLDAREREELAIPPADDRGPAHDIGTVAIATPQGRRRTRRQKGSMFRAVCG